MVKSAAPVVAPPPSVIDIATSPRATLRNVRVLDADTGAEIAKVLSADSDAGKVRRFDVDENGDLVREANTLRVIEEDRAVRIEWIDPDKAPPVVTNVGEEGEAKA